jgi:hypothetical protein
MITSPLEAREIAFGRVVIAALELLIQEMDEVVVERSLEAETHRITPAHRTAETANCIGVLGRRLIREIQQYERSEAMRRQRENEEEEDMPF